MKNQENSIGSSPVEIISAQGFIVVYRGLDKALCDAIIDLFDRDEKKWRGKIGRSGAASYDEGMKRSWDLEIRNEGAWADVFQRVHPRISACMSHYLSSSPVLQSFDLEGTGYKIQMYPKNEGYFRWHADAVGKYARDRVAASVLYLNDVAKGGETEFFHQRMKISPKAGNLVIFPAGWDFMHCAHKPESGDKYIISAFMRIKD